MLFSRIFKFLFRSGIVFLLLVNAYVWTDFFTGRIVLNKEDKSMEKTISAYVLSNGVHTDMVLPLHTRFIDWDTVFPFGNIKSKAFDYHFIAVGWGDKGFYLNTPEWKDLKTSTALNAAFGLSAAAIHATYYRDMIPGNLCKKVSLNNDQYRKLVQYILSSLDRQGSCSSIVIPTNAQYGEDDAFYEAKGKYSLFHTCNTWTNDALKTAGTKACLWTFYDKDILRLY